MGRQRLEDPGHSPSEKALSPRLLRRFAGAGVEEITAPAQPLEAEPGAAHDPLRTSTIPGFLALLPRTPRTRVAPSLSDGATSPLPAEETRIDREFRLVAQDVGREMEMEFPLPEDEALRLSLSAFFTLFEMLRRGWIVTRGSPPSDLKTLVEELGCDELTMIYKDNMERLLAAILRWLEGKGYRVEDAQRQRIHNQARRIHYLKYLEEGEARVIRSHFDRCAQKLPETLFVTSAGVGAVALAAGFGLVGLSCLLLSSGALKLWGTLRWSHDLELRMLSQRILGSLELGEADRMRLICRLIELYRKAITEGEGQGQAGWLHVVAQRSPVGPALAARPRWLNDVVKGHLITAATLAQSVEELRLVFGALTVRLGGVHRRALDERLLLFGVLTSLADRISAVKREPEFQAQYLEGLKHGFRLLGIAELRHQLGGEFVEAVARFGCYEEFMLERFGVALHHGRHGLWNEFDAYLRLAGRHPCRSVLEELLRVAETVKPCRDGCSYSDGLSAGRVILYDRRRRALYQALWIVYLHLPDHEKARYADRIRLFLDRAVYDENARIARDILQKMAHQGYLTSPAVVELLARSHSQCDTEARRLAQAMRERHDRRFDEEAS